MATFGKARDKAPTCSPAALLREAQLIRENADAAMKPPERPGYMDNDYDDIMAHDAGEENA